MPMIEIRGIENKQEYEVVTLEQIPSLEVCTMNV